MYIPSYLSGDKCTNKSKHHGLKQLVSMSNVQREETGWEERVLRFEWIEITGRVVRLIYCVCDVYTQMILYKYIYTMRHNPLDTDSVPYLLKGTMYHCFSSLSPGAHDASGCCGERCGTRWWGLLRSKKGQNKLINSFIVSEYQTSHFHILRDTAIL